MGWVDADAHVVESPLTWDYLLPSEQKFRPQLFKPEGDTQKAHWVIDGKDPAGCSVTPSARKTICEEVRRHRPRDDDDHGDTVDLADVAAQDQEHIDELWVSTFRCFTRACFSIMVSRSGPTPMSLFAAPTTAGWRTSGSKAKDACAGWRRCRFSACRTRWTS